MTFRSLSLAMDHLVWYTIVLVVYAGVDTATEYNGVVHSLHYDEEGVVNFSSSKASTYYLVSSNNSDRLVSLIKHAATQLPDEESGAEGVTVNVFNQCDDLAHSPTDNHGDEDDEIVINRFELVAIGAIIAIFAVVLLLATCLLITLLNRFSGGAVVYDFEQSKCASPSAAVRAKRAGVEDVPFRQSSHECSVPSRQVPKKKSSKSYLRILLKLSTTVHINQRLIKLLITITSSALESKTSAASLENELIELQRNMDKVQKNNTRLKNNAQKFKMKSDHHRRQESYLEDRCEELRKHNEHLMNFFKMINKQKTHDHVDEAVTDEEYPVQEESPCHQK